MKCIPFLCLFKMSNNQHKWFKIPNLFPQNWTILRISKIVFKILSFLGIWKYLFLLIPYNDNLTAFIISRQKSISDNIYLALHHFYVLDTKLRQHRYIVIKRVFLLFTWEQKRPICKTKELVYISSWQSIIYKPKSFFDDHKYNKSW